MSTFKYFQQQLLTDLSAKALEGEFTELKLIYKALYNDEDLTRSIGSVTVDDIINSPNPAGLRGPVLDLFRPQTLYLTDKVTLLDFDDFENNVKMLLEAFGQNILTTFFKCLTALGFKDNNQETKEIPGEFIIFFKTIWTNYNQQ